MQPPLLGAHVSIAGGFPRAAERAGTLGCRSAQVFVKSPGQWSFRRLEGAEVAAFRSAAVGAGLEVVVAHATYLLNLASRDRDTLRRSRRTLSGELERCQALGLAGLVLHPGAHLGEGEADAVPRIAASLDAVLQGTSDRTPRVLLENTAGQGTVVGRRLERLAAIRDACAHGGRLGICVDTCHAFAGGYPIHRRAGYERLVGSIDRLFGLEALGCLHLNDSRNAFDSRRDRHANIGEGEIGLEPFSWIVNDRRLRHVPMILETPRGDDGHGHRRDLATLRDACGSC